MRGLLNNDDLIRSRELETEQTAVTERFSAAMSSLAANDLSFRISGDFSVLRLGLRT